DETAHAIDDPLPDQPDDQHRSAFVTLDTDKTTVRPQDDSISLTATARYDDWSPAPGRTITFGPVEGIIAPPNGLSGPDGIVVATFTPAPTAGGQVRLVATCEGSEGFAVVTVQSDEPTELDLIVTPRRLRADGKATANLAAEAYTKRLNPAVGVTVRFEDDAGGRVEPPSAVTDQSGTARAVYTMPHETGLDHVTITATAEAAAPRPELIETRTIRVVESTLELTVDRDRIPPGSTERVWVTAQLSDDEQQPLPGERLIAEVAKGDGKVYPESATTGAEGTAEISYIPGDRMGPVVITVRHEAIADLERSVDIDQSAPSFETTDGSGPVIRVLISDAAADRNMGIELDDVIGVQVLDPSGTAWTGGVSPDSFVVAAFVADHGVRKDDYYTEAADGLRRRAEAASDASSRLSGLAAQKGERIDQAAWLQAIHDDYYKPIEELAVAATALLGFYVAAKLAVAKAGAVIAAKLAALGPAKAISATVMAKIKAQAAVAGAAEFISLPALKEIGEKIVVDGLKWVKGKLVTDFDALRHQHGLLLTQVTIFDRLAPTAQRAAETWQKVGHTGGPPADVRSLLAVDPDSVTWSLQQVDQEMRSAERDRLHAFGADSEAMAMFDEDERRWEQAREESRKVAQATLSTARSLEEMWRTAVAQRGGS
ncbi:Ig-like domain-containing protein, partial [bacterium]|nr:Ig-like domain-containing protein [bacterium]